MTEPGRLPEGSAGFRRRPPSLFSFTVEGRRAPGLFVVGWLATLAGAGLLVVGLGSSGLAATVFTIAGLVGLAVGLTALAGSQGIEARGVDDALRATDDRGGSGRPSGSGGYAGPSPILVFAAAVPVALVLSIALVPVLRGLGVDPDSPAGAFGALLATGVAYLGLVRLVVVGTGALSWAEMGVRRPRGLVRELLYGAVLAVPVLYGSGILALVLGSVFAIPEPPLPPATEPYGRALNLVSGALLAPVVEEVFFRGFVTTAWLRRYGATAAIVRGAVFFAFAHVLTVGGESFAEGLERAAFAFVVRIPIALLLGWLFVRRGSLAAAIGCHATFNGLPLAILAVG
ncbi:MAG TPA: type II CAAX endopeptidase family protein [Candidatus Binatia bacterium]|nr:type II CAAX endopeptidase family protein [Candidatus Binatia bacterium]